MNTLLDRLESVAKRYEELNQILMDPNIASDVAKMTAATKEQGSLEKAYSLYKEYKELLEGIDESKELLNDSDPEIREMAKAELSELEEKRPIMEHDIQIELIPKDPRDDKNILVDIYGSAGGDEANIFAGDLFRMYSKYAESQGWTVEVQDAMPGAAGGYAKITFMVKGQNVYSKLKYESGTHRVQRVPKTESQGRLQTSTARVVVMPEADPRIDFVPDQKDLRIDTYRSSGAGGQHINKTDSAVRITHIPTGIVATSQDGRSQHDNRDKAMQSLITRVNAYYNELKEKEEGAERKSKVGTGDRAEKIRTYNYPQNRVTDHRIGLSIQQLDRIMDGKLDPIIEALINEDQKRKLEEGAKQ